MASAAQIAANRRNAAKSTGPKSAAGKAASSRNGLKHGMTARSRLVFDETMEDFTAFHTALRGDYEPAGAAEEEIVERIVMAAWCLRRAWRMEAAAIDDAARPTAEHRARQALKVSLSADPPYGLDPSDERAVRDVADCRIELMPREELMGFAADAARPRPPAAPPQLVTLTRYQAHYERMLNRAQSALRQLRAARRAEDEARREAARARAEAAEFEALMKRGLRRPHEAPRAATAENFQPKPIPATNGKEPPHQPLQTSAARGALGSG